MLCDNLNRPPRYPPLNSHNSVNLISCIPPNAPFNCRGSIRGGVRWFRRRGRFVNIESFDASTTPIDALGLGPSTPPPMVPPNSTRVAAQLQPRRAQEARRDEHDYVWASWVVPHNRIAAIAWTAACIRKSRASNKHAFVHSCHGRSCSHRRSKWRRGLRYPRWGVPTKQECIAFKLGPHGRCEAQCRGGICLSKAADDWASLGWWEGERLTGLQS